MISRREFHAFSAAGTALALAAVATVQTPAVAVAAEEAPSSGPAPSFTENSAQITVDNGRVQAVFDKASNARLVSLKLDGQELLGTTGRGRFDQVASVLGAPGGDYTPGTTFAVRQEQDFVVVSAVLNASASGPYARQWNFIFRSGEPGFHLAPRFSHSSKHAGVHLEQHRFVAWVDPEIFTHASVEEDTFGQPWRADAARMPTPQDLQAGPMVMDATHDLAGTRSAYARRYYTKYDWAVSMKDHSVHGLYGNGYGIWSVTPNRESFNGGPFRQDLTLHQTTEAPVLLVEPHATHFGAMPVDTYGDWAKTYGPYFVLLTRGSDPQRMREEAVSYARFDKHAAFYDRVALEGWVPTAARVTVSGKAKVPGQKSMGGALVILSDNRVPAQDTTEGFQYWAEVDRNGSFELKNVRPGIYRVTVVKPGVWGEHVIDDVVVDQGVVRLANMVWKPVAHGRTVWQLGTPDRTSAEFRRGQESRRYDAFTFFAGDFPDGVHYVVGESGPEDWGYIQHQVLDGKTQAPWSVSFTLDTFDAEKASRKGQQATLTVALAAWAMGSAVPVPNVTTNLTIRINGQPFVWEFQPSDAKGATYRSSHAGRNYSREFRFDAALLKSGVNTVTFTINDGADPVAVNQAAYDAIRLELD